jgi:hypothetical protein
VDGYGIFLSKPYRMVDLDHCLQRVLAAANIRVTPLDRATNAERTPARSSEAQPGGAPPSRRPVLGKADGRDDESSGQWSAELSRQLADRAAQQQAVDPGVAKAARRAALMAYDRARSRRLRLVLGFAIGAALGSAIAILGVMAGVLPDPLSIARTEAAPPVETVTGALAAIPPEARPSSPAPVSASLAANVPQMPTAEPQASQPPAATEAHPAPAAPEPAAPSPPPPAPATKMEPMTSGQSASVEPESNQTPLGREEVKEVQARLRSFGFNPGPIDGTAGTMTAGAVTRYQQARGEQQTGTIDRELLAQLRQDPTPQPAQRAVRPEPRAAHPPPPRRADPFEPVRAASERFGQWLDSWLR